MKTLQTLLVICFSISLATCGSITVGVLNDIHFDPYYDAGADISQLCRNNSPLSVPEEFINPNPNPFGHFGCDSPQALIDLMLDQMKDLSPDLHILLVSGDMLGHGFSVGEDKPDHYDLIKDNIEKVFMTLSNKFPNTIILPAIGNNDIKYHYRAPTQDDEASDYYGFISDIMLNKMPGNGGLNKGDINKTLLKYGYYRADISNKLSVLSFNSLYYNSIHPSTEQQIRTQQLDWIEDQLANSEKNRKFIIFFHIYPGVYEAYRQQFFWEDEETERFVQIMEDHSDRILTLLGAHTHFGDIRVHQKIVEEEVEPQGVAGYLDNILNPMSSNTKITKTEAKFPMLVTPSITPIFLNNPGLTLFDTDTDKMFNVKFSYMELYRFPTTPEQAVFSTIDFKKEFGIEEFNAQTAQNFLERAAKSSYLLYFKLLPHRIGYSGLLKTVAWAVFGQLGAIGIWSNSEYMCMSMHMTKSDFMKCMDQ